MFLLSRLVLIMRVLFATSNQSHIFWNKERFRLTRPDPGHTVGFIIKKYEISIRALRYNMSNIAEKL
jgi:hypothetical protein